MEKHLPIHQEKILNHFKGGLTFYYSPFSFSFDLIVMTDLSFPFVLWLIREKPQMLISHLLPHSPPACIF